jgi:uncharacterized peroxidase-related enzyme
MYSENPTPRIRPLEPGETENEAATLLATIERRWGKLFNVAKVIANAPMVLKVMDSIWSNLGKSSLSVADRELIAMELAVSNGCHYCVPAHRYAAHEESGLAQDLVAQLDRVSNGETLDGEGRMAIMQQLVRRLEATRGGLGDEEFQQFRDRGVTPQQMIETIAEIAHCTITNFTNRLARTPLDEFTEPYR